MFGDQESVPSLSTTNIAELPNILLDEFSGPPLPDQYHHPLRLKNQTNIQPTQYLRHQIIPASKRNNNLQYSTIIWNQELTILTQTTVELKFEKNLKLNELIFHLIPTSTKSNIELLFVFLLRLVYILFSLTNLQLIINGEVKVSTSLFLL